MTNEEKARELQLDYIENGCGDSTDIRCACEEMAEWKDQQFKEYLEKKKDNYMHHREMWQQDTFEWGCYDSQIDTIDQIINELFGE